LSFAGWRQGAADLWLASKGSILYPKVDLAGGSRFQVSGRWYRKGF